MTFNIWWVIGAGWGGILIGFLAGCCWFGICKANDNIEEIIADENRRR